MSFRDKVTIVTGAASGIGREICLQIAAAGGKVLVTDINAKGAANVAAECGEDALWMAVDVADAHRVRQMFDYALQQHSRIDYSFHNAGFAVAGDMRDIKLEHWRSIVEVNLMGVVHCTQCVYPIMTNQGFGHIINVASLAGLIGAPTLVPYATTKAAVVGLSLSLRTEARSLGVNVSAFCPGFIQSNIYDSAVVVNIDRKQLTQSSPLPIVPTAPAIRKLLAGVLKNKAIITLPAYAQILWRMHRLSPSLSAILGERQVMNLRKNRGA